MDALPNAAARSGESATGPAVLYRFLSSPSETQSPGERS